VSAMRDALVHPEQGSVGGYTRAVARLIVCAQFKRTTRFVHVFARGRSWQMASVNTVSVCLHHSTLYTRRCASSLDSLCLMPLRDTGEASSEYSEHLRRSRYFHSKPFSNECPRTYERQRHMTFTPGRAPPKNRLLRRREFRSHHE